MRCSAMNHSCISDALAPRMIMYCVNILGSDAGRSGADNAADAVADGDVDGSEDMPED